MFYSMKTVLNKTTKHLHLLFMHPISKLYVRSPRDWGHMGIKWKALNAIYRWKDYHIGFQKICVGESESVTGKSYCTPS